VDDAGDRSFKWFADEKMNVLGHDYITGDNKLVTQPCPL